MIKAKKGLSQVAIFEKSVVIVQQKILAYHDRLQVFFVYITLEMEMIPMDATAPSNGVILIGEFDLLTIVVKM